MSVAELAKKFSADPSGKKGGAYGCFAPVEHVLHGRACRHALDAAQYVPDDPREITYDNAEAALFVAPTKRTATPFAKAETAVLSDLENANATAANLEKEQHPATTRSIAIDPAFGRWGLGTSGPAVFAPATPSSGVVGATTVAALGAGASTYK